MFSDVRASLLDYSYSASFHLLAYACLLGMTIWHSYISSTIARKTLPREQLGSLQGKLFPVYFSLQTVLSGLCLLTTSNSNAFMIFLIGAICGLINLIVLGPRTTK